MSNTKKSTATTLRNVKLSQVDRLTLPTIQKQQGTYVDMLMNRDITKKVEMDAKELTAMQLMPDANGTVSFTDKHAKTMKEIEFTEGEFQMIRDRLKEINEKGEITIAMMHLYEVFAA